MNKLSQRVDQFSGSGHGRVDGEGVAGDGPFDHLDLVLNQQQLVLAQGVDGGVEGDARRGGYVVRVLHWSLPSSAGAYASNTANSVKWAYFGPRSSRPMAKAAS